MDNIKINTIRTNLTARYGKMKLDIDAFNNGRRVDITIEDAADHCHVNPYIKWQPKTRRFTYKLGTCFGGQGADRPEFNDKLRALAKDKTFIKWFMDNVLPLVDKNAKKPAKNRRAMYFDGRTMCCMDDTHDDNDGYTTH